MSSIEWAPKPLTLRRHSGQWWIRDPNNDERPDVGPYESQSEAREDRDGLDRFWRHEWPKVLRARKRCCKCK